MPLLCETRSTVYQTARVGVDFLCNLCSKHLSLRRTRDELRWEWTHKSLHCRFHANSTVIIIRFSRKIEIGWKIFRNTLIRPSLMEIRSSHPVPFTCHQNKSYARCKRAERFTKLCNLMRHSPSSEGYNSSVRQYIPRFSKNSKGHYCAHMMPPLQPVLSQMNSVHISYSYPTSLTTSFTPLKSRHFP